METTLIFTELEAAAKAAGSNLSEVCRVANVDRSVLERWKAKNPKSLDIVNSLRAAIEKIKEQADAESSTVSK